MLPANLNVLGKKLPVRTYNEMSFLTLRKEAGMTQEDVAREMNISLKTYVNWESGKTEPRISEYNRLIEIFKKSKRPKNKRAS